MWIKLLTPGTSSKLVDSQIGNFGRPAHVWFVSQLPKTRSGKMLRRTARNTRNELPC
ncbi:AMP-binding enzyme, partial [Escherichia coli]|uniref:AMP-binding enzyme n=1 Tax=Escherichia coli TaxID=562 RepID=UPI002FCE49E4